MFSIYSAPCFLSSSRAPFKSMQVYLPDSYIYDIFATSSIIRTLCLMAFSLTHSSRMPGRKKDWCFICEFEVLLLKAREGKSLLSPIRILSKIHKIGIHLGQGREEDAHEFLR